MKRAIVKGAVWMLLLRMAERSLGLVSILILARLLVPADFGLVAMAVSVIAFVELGNSFGFELALIQREHLTRQHYDTAWTLQVVFGAGCALLNVVLAYPTAWFYGDSRLPSVMLVLAAGWLIQSFENIGVVEFRRQMDFSREFAFLAMKRITGFTVTLSLALMFQTYWAFVAGMIASRLAGVALSYGLQPYRPRWSLAAYRDLFSFSGWIFVVNLLSFASTRSSHFIVGRLHGSVALGLYTVGSEMALLPVTDLAAPINRAVRALRLSVRSYLAGLWRPIIAATAMVLVVTIVRHELAGGHRVVGSLFQLAVTVPIGIVIYTTTLILLWIVAGRPRSAESLLLERAVQAVSGLRRNLGQKSS